MFTKNDTEKLAEFLNMVALKAEFNNMSIKDNIKLFGLLSFLQQTLIPKIESNILEVIKHTPAEPKKVKTK